MTNRNTGGTRRQLNGYPMANTSKGLTAAVTIDRRRGTQQLKTIATGLPGA